MKNINDIKSKAIAVFVMLSLIFSNGIAQDGAKLFKQNCGACHKVDKNSVGPKLQGVKAKWTDAGEEEYLYEWVTDPSGLYESGKSNMAKEIWDFSPTAMTPMAHLTKEEMNAIFSYCDAPPAPVAAEVTAEQSAESGVEEPVQSYSMGERAIITLIIVLLIVAIWVMSNAKKALTSDPDAKGEKTEVVTLSKVLVGAVDIEDEASILMDHDYDGIKELDNELPPWWVWMFYATIIFGAVYITVYHVLDSAPLQAEAYEIEMKVAKEEVEAYKLSAGMAIDETNVELLTDEASLEEGKVIFTENCAVCHGQSGEGASGPNLTDDAWLYGGDVKKVFGTVKKGTKKGMPEHESKFNPLELQRVVSYVLSMPYAEGKAPEGEKE